MHVPQAGEFRESLRQPHVPVTLRLYADPPPLVGHLVRTERLLGAALVDRLERHHREIHQAWEGLAVGEGDLGGVVPLEQRRSEHVCEERQAVRHVTTHVLLGLELPAEQRVELPVRVDVHLHRHGGDPGVGYLELVEFPKIEGRLAGRSLGHPARCPHIALVVSVH